MMRIWITERLKELGKTQTGLAHELGVAPPRINDIIKGKRTIKVEELVPLSRFLEMHVLAVMAKMFPDESFWPPAAQHTSLVLDFNLFHEVLNVAAKSLKLNISATELTDLTEMSWHLYEDIYERELEKPVPDRSQAVRDAAGTIARLLLRHKGHLPRAKS